MFKSSVYNTLVLHSKIWKPIRNILHLPKDTLPRMLFVIIQWVIFSAQIPLILISYKMVLIKMSTEASTWIRNEYQEFELLWLFYLHFLWNWSNYSLTAFLFLGLPFARQGSQFSLFDWPYYIQHTQSFSPPL